MTDEMDDINIFRAKHRDRYTTIDNALLQDSRLSFGSRGLLGYVLSLPDNWKFTLAGLAKQSPEKRCAVERLTEELIEMGYATKKELFGEKSKAGRFSNDNYQFSEKVAFLAKFTDAGFPQRFFRSGFSAAENQQQQNNNIENTKIQNNKIRKEFDKSNSGVEGEAPHSGVTPLPLPSAEDFFLSGRIESSEQEKAELLPKQQSQQATPENSNAQVSAQPAKPKADPAPASLLCEKIGVTQETIDLIHRLYDEAGLKTNQLPKNPLDRRTKTFDSLVSAINALQTGTFVDEFRIDKKWLSEFSVQNGINSPKNISIVLPPSEIEKVAKSLIVERKKAVSSILSLFVSEYSTAGTKVEPYSPFLKHYFRAKGSDIKTKISKIQDKIPENVRKVSEKFHNTMTAKFKQTFSDIETLRFWTAVTELEKWYKDSKERLDYFNTDGKHKQYIGTYLNFLCTLYSWLDESNGAWGSLFPDIIIINGKQWDEFAAFCDKTYGIKIIINGKTPLYVVEAAYRDAREKRKLQKEEDINKKVRVLTEKILDDYEDLSWGEAEGRAKREVLAEYVQLDLAWQTEWDKRIQKAKEDLNG